MAKYDYQIYYDNNFRSEFKDCENRLDMDAMGKCTTCIINNKNERYLVNMAHVLFVIEVIHDELETLTQESKNDILDTKLADCKFFVRTKAVFKLNSLVTIRDLVKLTHKDFVRLRNVSNEVICEVNDFLIEHDLAWGMDV